MLSALLRAGLVKSSSSLRVGLVTNWTHQRIDKPRPSKWKDVEIQWDNASSLQDGSEINLRMDRIGSDRIGEESLRAEGARAPSSRRPKKEPLTNQTWEAYRRAYSDRYGTDPVRNKTVNGKLAQFVGRIGQEEAPLVAAFFVTHNNKFYVEKMHPVGMLLLDAEKLRTEWLTGRQVTGSHARTVDRAQSTTDAFQGAFARLNPKGGDNA
jgi:hypothetical protein